MMEWIFENSLPAVIVGAATAAILGGGWLQTGQKWLLYLMLAVIVVTGVAIAVERMVVTDRERIRETLFGIARLVENNEVDRVLDFAYSGAPDVRQMADSELRLYRFQSVDIKRNLRIEVFPEHLPPRATAEFNVVVVLGTATGTFGNQRIPRFVEVTFYQETEGDWRVAAYSHDDAQRGWTNDEMR